VSIDGAPDGITVELQPNGQLSISGRYNPNRGGIFNVQPEQSFDVSISVRDPQTGTTSTGRFGMFFFELVEPSVENPTTSLEEPDSAVDLAVVDFERKYGNIENYRDIGVAVGRDAFSTALKLPGPSGLIISYTVDGANAVIEYGLVKRAVSRQIAQNLDKRWGSSDSIVQSITFSGGIDQFLSLQAVAGIPGFGRVQDDQLKLELFLKALHLGVDVRLLIDFFGGVPTLPA